jgi:hypothetical protein
MHPWPLITNFGDSAVMLPAALIISFWLIAGGAWRATLVWLAAFGLGASSSAPRSRSWAGASGSPA